MKRYVILDRDGTIIVEKGYLADPEGVQLLPRAAEGLRRFRELGFGLIVATNQSGIGRRYFDTDRLAQVHDRVRELLDAAGVKLDGIYFCPHVPEDDCACRKPRAGLLRQAAANLKLASLDQSIVIGDKACDIGLGAAVGARTILVRTGYGSRVEADGNHAADHVVDDLREAARLVERLAA